MNSARLNLVRTLISLFVGSLGLPLVAAAQSPTQTGVRFGGAASYVTFGAAPLGTAAFTLELWVKREGIGQTATTGSDGVTAVPLLTRGRADGEGSNTDVNYFLGIDASGKLVADFEEGVGGVSPGLNHPVIGATTLAYDTWYHVAATYDGISWRLYVNGAEDSALIVVQPPRSDGIQATAIGSALRSSGVPSGFFDGVVDEVRIWSIARMPEEIQNSMNLEIPTAPNLLARWGLNEGDGTSVNDSSGNLATGTLISSYFTWVEGAPFRGNQAPAEPVLIAPANNATDVPTLPTFDLSVADPDGDPLTVMLFGGLVPTSIAPEFTIVAIPDTQHYVDDPNRAPQFTAQTQWIVANKFTKNIVFVTHLGDVVEHYYEPVEWTRADSSLAVLEAGNMTWGLAPGNHDMNRAGTATNYDIYFPVSRFEGYPWYGGYLGKDPVNDVINRQNKDNYELFSVGGLDFIIIHLEYDMPGYAVEWADRILKQYPNRRAIISTHLFLSDVGARPAAALDREDGTSAETVWRQLIRTNCNVFLVLNGHYSGGESRRTDRSECGQPVHQLLSDYQARVNGGDGWLRYMTFKPAENKVYVYTFSPTLNGGAGLYETDANSQFVLDYNMQGASFAPIAVGTGVASGSQLTTTLPEAMDLPKGREFEWYAQANDGLVTTASPVRRFTTSTANRVPVANDQTVQASENVAQVITLTASDRDGDPLTFTIVAGPSHGTLSGTAPLVTYTPASGYNGADSFTFQVSDGISDSNIAAVSINVFNQPPVANDQAVTTVENTAIAITLTASNAEPDPLTFSIVSGPAHGILSGTAPNLSYTPESGYYGTDSFSFKANDGHNDSNSAVVSITITPVMYTLTLSINGTSGGTVTSSPAGIACAGSCSASFVRGTTVTLAAQPNSSAMFGGWSQACTGNTSCVLTMNAPMAVTATFMLNGGDLVEASVSDPPGAATQGGAFAITDTVRNDGAVAVAASTTRFLLSADAVKGAGDTLLTGSRSVPELGAGISSTTTTTVTVPATAPTGSYLLLACADYSNTVVELSEANNCAVSGTIIQITRPDLVVMAVSGPVDTSPGAKFSASDTVKNQGLVTAGGSSTRYYLSVDSMRSGDDVVLAEARSVTGLAASGISTGSKNVTVPVSMPVGTYYLIACADDFQKVIETVETNNCLASQTQLFVAWADLIVAAITNPPARIVPGSSFSVTDTVINQGQVTAAATRTGFYLSIDAVFDTMDVLLSGSRPASILAPGASSTGTRNETVPTTTPAGTYLLIACADDLKSVGENDENNNCLASTSQVLVGYPDLVETALANPPQSAAPGGSFSVTDTVQNQGVTDAGTSSTRFYLSLSQFKDGSQVLLTGTRSIPLLAPGATSSGTRSVTIPTTAPAGVYFLLACADDLAARVESNESNNCRASGATIQIITP